MSMTLKTAQITFFDVVTIDSRKEGILEKGMLGTVGLVTRFATGPKLCTSPSYNKKVFHKLKLLAT